MLISNLYVELPNTFARLDISGHHYVLMTPENVLVTLNIMIYGRKSFLFKEIENVETDVRDKPKVPVIVNGISMIDEL